jgi:hypothetical protein
MSINFSAIGSTLSGILTSAGLTGANLTSTLSSLIKSSNPNQSDELAICTQILVASGNTALQQALATKLATEVGIPADAAALAMSLGSPGVDIPNRVLQIESLIRAGT